MPKKLGVYVCRGCEIGSCLDTEKLVQIASAEYQAPVVRTSSAFCLEDVQLIRQDTEQRQVDTVVIAACSGRVNTDVFSFKPAVVERVNLREQVVWSHPPHQEETQKMAEDYLRMGIIKAMATRLPQPSPEANERAILVVGGGNRRDDGGAGRGERRLPSGSGREGGGSGWVLRQVVQTVSEAPSLPGARKD